MSTSLGLGIFKINMMSNTYKPATINSLTIKAIFPLL